MFSLIDLDNIEQTERKGDLARFIYEMLAHAMKLETQISNADIQGYLDAFEDGWFDGSKYTLSIKKRPLLKPYVPDSNVVKAVLESTETNGNDPKWEDIPF